MAAGPAAGAGGRFALARYDADGTLDASFGSDGKVTTNFTAGEDVASALAIQPDGRLVAAGHAGSASGLDHKFAVARYLGE